jgi:hypothetical protein
MQHALDDLEVGTKPKNQPCVCARCDCRARYAMVFIEKQTTKSMPNGDLHDVAKNLFSLLA